MTKPKPKTVGLCVWSPILGTFIHGDRQWATGCGESIFPISTAGFRFCPFCGKPPTFTPTPPKKGRKP